MCSFTLQIFFKFNLSKCEKTKNVFTLGPMAQATLVAMNYHILLIPILVSNDFVLLKQAYDNLFKKFE